MQQALHAGDQIPISPSSAKDDGLLAALHAFVDSVIGVQEWAQSDFLDARKWERTHNTKGVPVICVDFAVRTCLVSISVQAGTGDAVTGRAVRGRGRHTDGLGTGLAARLLQGLTGRRGAAQARVGPTID